MEKKITKSGRSHRKLTYKTPFRIMVQTRKYKEIAETSARNPKTNHNILHLNPTNAVCLHYVSMCLFDWGFLYLKLAYACTSTLNLHFIHLGTGQVGFSPPPSPLPLSKELCSNTVWENCVTILYDEDYNTLYRLTCNGWTKIKKHTIG